MAKGDEITTKFKVDISDLKKGINEATQQIKLADATFKAATAGMDNWSKSTDGLKAKLSQLDSTLSAQKSKLESYTEQLKRQENAYAENGKRIETIKAQLAQLAEQGVSKTSAEYKKLENALASCEKEQESNGKSIDKLKISIVEQQGAINKTQADIGKYSNSLNELEKSQNSAADAAKKSESAYESLEKTISNQQSNLEALKKRYADVVLEQGKNSASAKDLAGEIDKLSSELNDNKTKLNEADKAADELDNSLDDLGNSAEQSSGGFTVLKGALANLVTQGIQMAIGAIKDFAKETINVGKEFDSSMSQVAAVSGATGDDLEALRDKAKEMGANTKFSASEAADAFNYMAMAGWKTEDMLGGIEGVLALAAAGNTDLATTSDIVTDALTAFGKSADDAGRLADIMAAASSNANTNVEMMGETFKYVAPVAGAMGYSMEDTSVAIGLMANAGIKAGQAGTSLRSILTRLAAPPKEAATAMNALGIEITNADGTMKPFSEVIGILREKFDGLSESQQTQYAKQIAGQEAMSGLLAIVNAAPEDVNKLTDAINNSNGAAEKMAEVMGDNLGGDLTQLGSKFEGVQIALYEKFEPALRSGVDVLSKMLDALMWVIDKGSQFVDWLNSGSVGAEAFKVVVIALTAAFTAFMAVLGAQAAWTGLIALIGKVKAGFIALNATMAANPIGLVIAAIAALVAAFMYLWNNCEEFREFWINLWDKIKEIASAAWEAITGFFSAAWEKIKEIWGKVGDWFKETWEKIKEAFANVKEWFSEKFTAAKDGIQNAWAKVKDWFANVWKGIQQAFQNADKWLSEKFGAAWDAIKLVWNTVTGYFKTIWESIKQIFSVVKDVLTGNWKGAWEGIKGIVDTWKKYFQGIWDGIKNVFSKVNTWFSDKFGAAWKAIKEKFSPISKWFSDVWDGIKKIFKGAGDWFGDIFDKVGKAVKAPLNAVIKAMNKVISGLNKISIDIPDWVPGVGGKTFGFNISKIPELAQGGVLRRGQMGLLEGSGAEAVVPLERNKAWINAVTNEMIEQLKAKGVFAGSSSSVSNARDYNFTQIINAPKQPSRIELYRQTRNLLAYANATGGE